MRTLKKLVALIALCSAITTTANADKVYTQVISKPLTPAEATRIALGNPKADIYECVQKELTDKVKFRTK